MQALTDFAGGTQTAIELETGAVLAEGSRDDGVRSLIRAGERAVAVPAPVVPIGYADGVLVVRSGSRVPAID